MEGNLIISVGDELMSLISDCQLRLSEMAFGWPCFGFRSSSPPRPSLFFVSSAASKATTYPQLRELCQFLRLLLKAKPLPKVILSVTVTAAKG